MIIGSGLSLSYIDLQSNHGKAFAPRIRTLGTGHLINLPTARIFTCGHGRVGDDTLSPSANFVEITATNLTVHG